MIISCCHGLIQRQFNQSWALYHRANFQIPKKLLLRNFAKTHLCIVAKFRKETCVIAKSRNDTKTMLKSCRNLEAVLHSGYFYITS